MAEISTQSKTEKLIDYRKELKGLAAGKIVKIVIDGVEDSFTVPAGECLDGTISFQGICKAV